MSDVVAQERSGAGAGSPRPTFEGPAHIRYGDVTRHLWGEPESGEVADWIYASTDKIHHLVFGLAPGQRFGHSAQFRTIFAADELFYVLSGTMVLSNPETGEVHVVEAGQAAFFRRDTWHHAISFGDEQLRVVEFFAPPPATGTSSSYSRTRELLRDVKVFDDRWLGRWPMARSEREAALTISVLRDDDLLWAIDGTDSSALTGLYVSTEHLTAGRTRLRPGGSTGVRQHAGDASAHVLSGTVHVLLPDASNMAQRWFELSPGDGFYVPEGSRYQFRNVGDSGAEIVFAVAPVYSAP